MPSTFIQHPLCRSFSHLLPGWVAMLIVTVCLLLGVFQPLEWIIYNQLFQLRGAINWDERVVLISIDDQSLKEFGQFPWRRKRYIDLLNVLNQAQPNVVAFDIVFADDSPDDLILAKAIEQHRRVVLAQAWDRQGYSWEPQEELKQAAITTGHILMKYKDGDGVVRRVKTQINGIPLLGIAALQVYQTFADAPPLENLDNHLWINWISKVKDIPQYSFVDVVQEKIPYEKFVNKIVVVGVTASGIDGLATPFNYDPPSTGVCLHTTVISNFFEDKFLRLLPPGWWVMLFLLGGPGLLGIIDYWQIRQKLRLLAGLSMIWFSFSLLMLKFNYLLPVAVPISLFTITIAVVIWYRDIRLTAENKYLHKLAYYDGLTQIANRRRFDEYLQQEWVRMLNEKNPLAVILCDVDFFKRYNDTYGHQAGDACLQKVAQGIIKGVKKPTDLVARYGGEEFAIILPNADLEAAMQVAEKVREQIQVLAIPHKGSQISQQITLSLGIACVIPSSDLTPEWLLKTADEALYQAKQTGRDRCCAFIQIG